MTRCRLHRLTPLRRSVAWSTIAAMLLPSTTGCSRRFWRLQAERDVYSATVEKLNDPRWKLPRIDRTPDPRSRFFDAYDPDHEPLPPDDPAAHRYMHCMDGRRGYKSWHKLGRSFSVENPQWLEPFGIRLEGQAACDPSVAHSALRIENATLPDTLELSYIHSREYQTVIEDLYLRSLDLTFDRFQFGVRYLGLTNNEPATNFFFNLLPKRRDEAELGTTRFGMSRLLPGGGTWLVELANDTLWLFGSDGPTSTASTLSYRLVQPLMLGAGRKVVLEELTQGERNVLYSARSLARFRQTFFTDTTSAYLDILQQQQTAGNERGNIERLNEQIEIRQALDSRRPEQIVEELDALPDGVVVPEPLRDKLTFDEADQELVWRGDMSPQQEALLLSLSDDLDFQRAAEVLVQRMRTEVVSLQLLQLVTRRNRSLNNLVAALREVQDRQDILKLGLGLPPNIGLTVNNAMLSQFELIDPEVIMLETSIRNFVDEYADVNEDNPDYGRLQDVVAGLAGLAARLREQALASVENDFGPMDRLLDASADAFSASPPGIRAFDTSEERDRVASDVGIDRRLFKTSEDDLEYVDVHMRVLQTLTEFADAGSALDVLANHGDGAVTPADLPEEWDARFRQKADLDDDGRISREELLRAVLVVAGELREEMLSLIQGLQVVQIGLRVDTIALNPFNLTGEAEAPTIEQAVQIGLERRVDLMNERALVMDARRRVEVAANALEAALDVVIDGDISTRTQADGNRRPFDLRGDRSEFRVGLEFKTPADMIDERNAYTAALVDYQRARRDYMAFEDFVKQDIRNRWRRVTTLRQQVEFDRQSIRSAALQYDNAAVSVLDPVQVQAGANAGRGSGLNLLNALNSILVAQNSLVRNWFSYERNRLNFFSDMGMMEIDELGLWQDEYYQSPDNRQDAER